MRLLRDDSVKLSVTKGKILVKAMAALDDAKCASRGLEVTVPHKGYSETEANVG